jgi:F0F1-type ATP synthase assembly protein I
VAVDKEKQRRERHLGKDLGESTGGLDLVLTGVVFALVGLWLDRRFGLTPILTIVLTIVGFVGAVLNIYYRYIRDIERLEAEAAALRSPKDTPMDEIG